MTDAKNQQAEPSMEEILASIRRIISEDTDTGKAQPAAASAPAEPPPPPPPPKASEPAPKAAEPAPKPAEPPPSPAPEVLELTEMVSDDGNVTDLDDKPEEPVAKPAEPVPAENEDERLVSQRAASAAAGALSGLQAATRRPETPRGLMGLGNAGMTLEEIVRAEMRPILKAWLDEHLPPLVERLVQKEIKRITRQVED